MRNERGPLLSERARVTNEQQTGLHDAIKPIYDITTVMIVGLY